MSHFSTPLVLEYIDGRLWRVKADFDYWCGEGATAELIRAPAGMITDFASVPRLLWSILPPTGVYGEAAVIHDHLYQSEGVHLKGSGISKVYTRAQCDAILLDGMKVRGVGWSVRNAIYSGVRIGGWHAWDSDRKQELEMLAVAAGLA